MKVLRIFPRKTNATPDDENVIINRMPDLFDTADQVNLGADSKHNHLPEPSKETVLALIVELEKFTRVKQKTNLKRLLR